MVVSLAATACGDGLETVHTTTPTETADVNEFLPLATGNTWTYRVTSDSTVTTKVTTVLERMPVGGSGVYAETEAFFVVTTKDDGTNLDKTESYQSMLADSDGLRTVRYRELSYSASTGALELEEHWDPPRLRIDDHHVVADGPWEETYTEWKTPADDTAPSSAERTDRWSVQSDAVMMTVPAGAFSTMMVKRDPLNASTTDKVYWFARGIGKIREAGGQTEELVDCTVGGKTCAELVE
jgi:hypothetical protein